MKIDRLLSIIMLLMSKDKVNAKQSADLFEVSVRTIQRDMDSLNAAGIPIISYQGKDGGYGIMPQYRLEKNYLSPNEWQLLITALEGFQKIYEDPAMDILLNKLNSLHRNQERKAEDPIILDFNPWGYNKSLSENIRILKEGIENHNVVSLSYRDGESNLTERLLEPIKLVLKVNQWYVVGFCRLRKEQRIFKLSRIQKLKSTVYFFKPRELEDFELFSSDKNSKIKLKLLFEKNQIGRMEFYFDTEDMEFLETGHILVSVNYPEDEWLYAMLMSFGDKMKIIEPTYLRDKLIDRIENSLKHHKCN